MKIFLLWEAYGEYEDYVEKPIGYYLTKEGASQAEKEKENEESLKEQQYYHCQACIASRSNTFSEDDIVDCEDFIFRKDNLNGCWCENEFWSYEPTRYWIEDVEVIE